MNTRGEGAEPSIIDRKQAVEHLHKFAQLTGETTIEGVQDRVAQLGPEVGLLTRTKPPTLFSWGGYVLDISKGRLLAVPVRDILTPVTRYRALIAEELILAAGGAVSKESLQEKLWEGEQIKSNSLAVHVYLLRKELDPNNHYSYIASVHHYGYRLLEVTPNPLVVS